VESGEYSVTSINFIAFQKRQKENYYIIEFQYNVAMIMEQQNGSLHIGLWQQPSL
jgi:hypothetical protein